MAENAWQHWLTTTIGHFISSAYAWSRSESIRLVKVWKQKQDWLKIQENSLTGPMHRCQSCPKHLMRKSVNWTSIRRNMPQIDLRGPSLLSYIIWISASLLRTEAAHGILPCSWPVPCPFDCMVILNFWASKFCFLLMPLTSQSKRLDATCWKQLVFTLLVGLLLRRDREGSKIHIKHSWLGSACCSSKCMRELRQIKTWDHTSSSRCLLDEKLEWRRMAGKKRKTLDH